MKSYQGQDSSDKIHNGGSYPNEDKHEVYNFKDVGGYYYGYVQPQDKEKCINLGRIDSKCEDSELQVDNVLVVWVATAPKRGRVIVGWYRDATVFRHMQYDKKVDRKDYPYNIRAKVQNCHLIKEVDKRNYEVPSRKKGFIGQSNIWYADKDYEEVQNWIKETHNYIKGEEKEKEEQEYKQQSEPLPYQYNQEKKKEVEQKAINYVKEYYKKLEYSVRSVETLNKGWDLEAVGKNKNDKLYIEVKGLSGDLEQVLITCNEHKKMKDKRINSNYRLFVVFNVLTKPAHCVFVLEDDGETWRDFDKELSLIFEPISYVARINSTKAI